MQKAQISEQSGNSENWIYPCLVSGLLLGLAAPSFSAVPLGFLAWVWCVPLFFELKRTEKVLPFLKRVLVAVGFGFLLITLWVVNASISGLPASAAMGVFVWTFPFVVFYFVRRFLSWNWAITSLPFVWTFWEWVYHSTELSFGAVRQGYLQADFLWLIQFADLTSVAGVTFWLILLNVAIFLLFEKIIKPPVVVVEPNRRKFLNATPQAIFVLALFAFPLAYSAFVFLKQQPEAVEISILAVQPNVSPFAGTAPHEQTDIFGKQLALTDRAVKTAVPDLILWHEVAVPYILTDNQAANNYLAKQITKWNTPVLTGLIAVKDYAENEPRPQLLTSQNRNREYFNAAAIFQPAAISNGQLPLDPSSMYKKRRLMPFLEKVPFSDRYPFLADLIIPIGVRPRLSYGEIAQNFDFQTKDGSTVQVGTMICYENLYPEMSADSVRGGAQFLTAITNEGFFAGSQGQYQLAAFSRFRAIETRRAFVRAAATGKSWSLDRFGRITAEVPMWSEQTFTARVLLSDEQTIYVRWGNYFPKICGLFVLLIILAAASQAIKQRAAKYRSTSGEV